MTSMPSASCLVLPPSRTMRSMISSALPTSSARNAWTRAARSGTVRAPQDAWAARARATAARTCSPLITAASPTSSPVAGLYLTMPSDMRTVYPPGRGRSIGLLRGSGGRRAGGAVAVRAPVALGRVAGRVAARAILHVGPFLAAAAGANGVGVYLRRLHLGGFAAKVVGGTKLNLFGGGETAASGEEKSERDDHLFHVQVLRSSTVNVKRPRRANARIDDGTKQVAGPRCSCVAPAVAVAGLARALRPE